ncbi:MAG: hypothetical protein LBJ99_00515 [Oscillospiraceae bacterium]|jgi:hypothetical protein|nr:hypothetical protein [Oscillospiraceae bacterium]
MKLPKRDVAVIPYEKLAHYALDPVREPNKAHAFKKALGYTVSNADLLVAEIHSGLDIYPAMAKGNYGYGELYEVAMNINGTNGKTANIITAWIDDAKNGEMRMTSVYVTKKRGVIPDDNTTV